jgi:hypothetical protein
MHPIIIRGISMFKKKLIVNDPNLMEIVVNNSHLCTSSDFMNKAWEMLDPAG